MSRRLLVATNATRGSELAARLEDGSSFLAKLLGLMGRSALPAGTGLWLPDSNNIHMLFMRFPIDAVFVSGPDADGTRRVVSIRHSLPAWRGIVWWVSGGKGVLELPAGTAKRTGTEVGDAISMVPADRAAGKA